MSKLPKEKLLVGAHTSAAGGVHKALLRGEEIGANTVQIFTSNQRQWKSKPIPDEEVRRWEEALEKTHLKKIMSHDSYLINLGAVDSEILKKSRNAFAEELERCHQLNIDYLNFHPGAATTASIEQCLERIVESLNHMENFAARGPTRLLLETTAGQGSNVGNDFAHLAYIIERVHKKVPIGVCIDTCHIFAAGYDIRTQKGWEETLEKFDTIIGLKHLYAFHMNDSLKPFASRKDRHAHLGEGEIGIDCFKVLMAHPKTRELPKYLETPQPEKWPEEIAMLREFAG